MTSTRKAGGGGRAECRWDFYVLCLQIQFFQTIDLLLIFVAEGVGSHKTGHFLWTA